MKSQAYKTLEAIKTPFKQDPLAVERSEREILRLGSWDGVLLLGENRLLYNSFLFKIGKSIMN